MARDNIDDILSELGVDPAAAAEEARRQVRRADEGKRRHSVDRAEQAFSPLPAVPAGQRSFAHNITVSADPAVPVAPTPAASPTVGEALSAVYQPEADAPTTPQADLAQALLAAGVATAQQLTAARQVIAQSPGRRLSEVLLEQGVDEAKLQQCVAVLAGVPFEHIDLAKGLDGGFDGKLLQRLTVEFCKSRGVLPLRTEGARTVMGVLRPDDVFVLDEVRRKLNTPSVKAVVVTGFELRGALEIVGDSMGEKVDVSSLLSEVEESDVQVEKKHDAEVDLEKEAAESPVIRYVNYIIQQAVKEGASDIHIEPAEKKIKVRFRIDGELYEMMQPPASMGAAIVSRLKIMANLDISERRLPQDGRIRCTVQGRKLDLRMSTLPCAYGEKVVLRILDTRSINVKLEDLGFDESILQIWRGLVNAPHGIVLVTGPTGSGKTTTLYSSLRTLDKNSMNISTVEDPIEYHLDGITQCQMHERIGMNFAAALRALLRQDPDVVMLGEIRDHETALVAVQAALTGHLVLSTLHTNDAPSSITRLVNIGLEPFLVAAAVNGVLAQRLIRRLCGACKSEKAPNDEMVEFLSAQGMSTEKVWSPKGCDKCRNTGYSGRVGIYELLTVDDTLRDIIVRNPSVSDLRRTCLERGMVTLRADGLKKAARGLTSIEEVLRVTESTI
ncbi:MAG: Flp pilus assembly complex ATPase component TadA [Phycisphaeraceae bacterium]|nr:Flp pilus assembly complex ATPase component TadA [Phycisphaeraceae bacterium]